MFKEKPAELAVTPELAINSKLAPPFPAYPSMMISVKRLVSSPDLILRVYHFQYNMRETSGSVSNQLLTKFCPRSHNLNLEWSEVLVLSLKCTSISLCQECKLSGSKTWFQTRVIICAVFAAKVRLSTTSTNFHPAVKIPMLNYRPSPLTQLPVLSTVNWHDALCKHWSNILTCN